MVSERQIVPFSLQSVILLTRIQVHSNQQRFALSEQADIIQKTPFDVIQWKFIFGDLMIGSIFYTQREERASWILLVILTQVLWIISIEF